MTAGVMTLADTSATGYAVLTDEYVEPAADD